MGILIVAGIGLLGYGLYSKRAHLGEPAATPQAAQPIPAFAAPPQALPQAVPPAQPGARPGQIAGGWERAPGMAPPAPLRPFDTLSLGEPAGSTVRTYQVSGSVLVLEVVGGGKPARFIAVDLNAGAIIGRLVPTDAP
ncbi:hypothetical protein Rru_A1112 [Rhodospirillum rubrum ATCC 11170]|uniref:Uncharacterized protein n=3 Tax=Rhodospirillum rubrum TaxID=1085 RepID=Q2RVD2_RHORT|nr:hypothetical protein Rru_A1112 [Rhodospirillum rubrum ATCC 11170]